MVDLNCASIFHDYIQKEGNDDQALVLLNDRTTCVGGDRRNTVQPMMRMNDYFEWANVALGILHDLQMNDAECCEEYTDYYAHQITLDLGVNWDY